MPFCGLIRSDVDCGAPQTGGGGCTHWRSELLLRGGRRAAMQRPHCTEHAALPCAPSALPVSEAKEGEQDCCAVPCARLESPGPCWAERSLGEAYRTFKFWTDALAVSDCTPVELETGNWVCSFCTVIWPKYLSWSVLTQSVRSPLRSPLRTPLRTLLRTPLHSAGSPQRDSATAA